MDTFDFTPFLISLKLASWTVLWTVCFGIVITAWLQHSTFRGKVLVETLLTLPLILPPSVFGFYFLILFSPNHFIGHFLKELFDLQLLFSFEGIVCASVVSSFPFMLSPIKAALTALPPTLKESAMALGSSPYQTFFKVELKAIVPGIASGCLMTFAHAMGEFGMVLMVGGNREGITRVASIALYHEMEHLNEPAAHLYASILCIGGLSILMLSQLFIKKAYPINSF